MRWIALAAALALSGPAISAEVEVLTTQTITVIEQADLDAAIAPLEDRLTEAETLAAQKAAEITALQDEQALQNQRLAQQETATQDGVSSFQSLRDEIDLTSNAVQNLITTQTALTAAIAELTAALDAVNGHVHDEEEEEVVVVPPPPPPPPPDSPFSELAYNTWMPYGEPISTIWAGINLDPLTAGTNGLEATVNSFSGAAYNDETKEICRGSGGHNNGGYNRVWCINAYTGVSRWASIDVRLDDPEIPESSCPYPSEHATLGDLAGPSANHWGDGFVATTDGSIVMWPAVSYYCRGAQPRDPNAVWKLSTSGEWSRSAPGMFVPNDVALAALPGNKVLAIGKYYVSIVNADTMEPESFHNITVPGQMHATYIDTFKPNIVAAGEDENGNLEFFLHDYHQNLYRFRVYVEDDGRYRVGWPSLVEGIKPFGYTAGATWLPDQQTLMMVHGHFKTVQYILFDQDTPELRTAVYDALPGAPEGIDYYVHDGGFQFDADSGTAILLGPSHNDGVWVFRPPVDIRAVSEPSVARIDLQEIIDNASAGDIVPLDGDYTSAKITTPDLTLSCTPGTRIGDNFVEGKAFLLVATSSLTVDGCTFFRASGRPGETAAISIPTDETSAATSGGTFTVKNTHIEGFTNGILTPARGWYNPIHLTVLDSTFVNNGCVCGRTPGHDIYLGNGGGLRQDPVTGETYTSLHRTSDDPEYWSSAHMSPHRLRIERSTFSGHTSGGHAIKSGAVSNIFRNVTVKIGEVGLGYRPFDLYAGGEAIFEDVDVVLHHDQTGPPLRSDNSELIGFATEAWADNYRAHLPSTDSITITRMTATCLVSGPTAYKEFSVIDSKRAVVPVWSGATPDNPAGDSTVTGCHHLYKP